MKTFYVYILASKRNGTLYIGLTNNIERRMLEHKTKVNKGFSSKYNVKLLVYFEEFESYVDASTRERQMKKWRRLWKLNLIEKDNPDWKDLSETWYD
ncbi:MAG: excinuclease ABC subunit C [Flavobacteriales bacterium]|nr:MAG: excinuclease ABC subunit C [Flavobacteriales bacterium]